MSRADGYIGRSSIAVPERPRDVRFMRPRCGAPTKDGGRCLQFANLSGKCATHQKAEQR